MKWKFNFKSRIEKNKPQEPKQEEASNQPDVNLLEESNFDSQQQLNLIDRVQIDSTNNIDNNKLPLKKRIPIVPAESNLNKHLDLNLNPSLDMLGSSSNRIDIEEEEDDEDD